MKSVVSLIAVTLLLVIMIIAPAIAADVTGTSVQPTNTTSQPAGNAVTGTADQPADAADSGTAEKADTAEEPQLAKEEAILWAFLGIFFSFAIPVLKKYSVQIVKKLREPSGGSVNALQEVWKAASPYLATTFLSLFVAVVVVASLYSAKTPMPGWYVPFLAGYSWDSTLQKLNPATPPEGSGV